MIGFGRLRQLAVGWWLDFEPAITRLMAKTRIVVADIGGDIDVAATIDRRQVVHALAKAELALHHAIGRIAAVDDDGDAGPGGNDDVEALRGERQGRRCDQNGESREHAHGMVRLFQAQSYRRRHSKELKDRTKLAVSLTCEGTCRG